MKGRLFHFPFVVLTGSLLIAGCTEVQSPADRGNTLRRMLTVDPHAPKLHTILDEFSDIARAEPTFGGWYVDSSGAVVVLATDVTRLASARVAGVDQMLKKRRLLNRQVKARRATYEFSQLREWYDATHSAVWSVPDVISTGIDPRGNRLLYGVASARAQGAVRKKLADLGVPQEAFALELESRPTLMDTTVEDRVRPLRGGLRIRWRGASGLTYTYGCTLGFTAHTDWSSPDSQFFFTASHCTAQYADSDGRMFFQADTVDSNYAGYEIVDRQEWQWPYFGCPGQEQQVYWFPGVDTIPYWYCRYSDAAKMYAGYISSTSGYIARTFYNDTTLATGYPGFYVDSEADSPAQGQEVWKMGSRTGQSGGQVLNVCRDYEPGPQIPPHGVLLCQSEVYDSLHAGDSGAPVFLWTSPDTTVALVGMVEAQGLDYNGNGTSYHYIFAPIENIHWDLGDFRDTYPY